MSNQEPQAPALSKDEQEELKKLQTARKETEGHLTDSERARLSELQAKAEPPAAAKATGAGATESKSPAGKK
jgi:hypothetical protein